MRATGQWLTLLVVTGLSMGLLPAPWLQAWEPPRTDSPPGVVFIVGGVGGFDVLGSSAQKALPKAGVRHEIREFVWTHGWGQIFKDLQDTPHLLHKADELTSEVRRQKAQHPEQPIYLVGKSGGTALVLAAAEQLPPQTVERIVLLSPAVSRAFDLSAAFSACFLFPSAL